MQHSEIMTCACIPGNHAKNEVLWYAYHLDFLYFRRYFWSSHLRIPSHALNHFPLDYYYIYMIHSLPFLLQAKRKPYLGTVWSGSFFFCSFSKLWWAYCQAKMLNIMVFFCCFLERERFLSSLREKIQRLPSSKTFWISTMYYYGVAVSGIFSSSPLVFSEHHRLLFPKKAHRNSVSYIYICSTDSVVRWTWTTLVSLKVNFFMAGESWTAILLFKNTGNCACYYWILDKAFSLPSFCLPPLLRQW